MNLKFDFNAKYARINAWQSMDSSSVSAVCSYLLQRVLVFDSNNASELFRPKQWCRLAQFLCITNVGYFRLINFLVARITRAKVSSGNNVSYIVTVDV